MHGSEPRRWPDEILDGLAEGVVVFDADGAAVTINPVAAEMLGGTEVYIADPRRRFVRQDGSPLPPEERPTAITRATGRAQDGVVVGLLDRGGAPRWIEIATRALGDSDGPPFPVAATFVDVSARVRAQQEARTWAAELERLAAGDAPLVEALFAQSAAGLALLGPDLRFVRVNDAAARLGGLPPEAFVGCTPVELFGEDGSRMEERAREVLETGEPLVDVEDEFRLATAPGLRSLRATISPVRDHEGVVVALGVVIADVTARRQAEAERERALDGQRRAVDRSARLQWVTAALSGALSTHDVAYVLAREATAAVDAERGWVGLLVPGGGAYEVVVTVGDPPAGTGRIDAGAAFPGPTAVREGRALYWTRADELADRHPEAADALRAVGIEAGAAVPIAGARGPWGFLGLGDGEPREYAPADREALEAIARQCGQALDRAAAFERDQITTDVLAQSLLPERLPDIPGIRLGTRLRPAGGPHAAVGGDFYDAFPVGPSSWLLLVGDVSGKGAEAAALTALVRYTVRAEALHDAGPRRLLHLVNGAILAQRSDLRFVTLACARLDLDGDAADLTLSAAGHPDTLVLRADGTGVALHVPGSILGVFGAPELSEVTMRLGPGDGIVLYTDGLLEAHAPERILASEDLLREPLLGLPRLSPDRLIDALLATAIEPDRGPPRDDVAVLVAELGP